MEGSLYDGNTLLASGLYTLSSDSPHVTGSIVVGKAPSLLNRSFLTLRLAGGEELAIVPRRVEHQAGGLATLLFEVAP